MKWKKLIVFIALFCLVFFLYVIYRFYKRSIKNKVKKELEILLNDLHNFSNNTDSKNFYSDIPVYYINMDKDNDRRENIENQLKKYFLKYQRVKGFNGYKIKNSKEDVVDDIKFKNNYIELTNSEIGTVVSHINAIKTSHENGDDIALIMEDDIDLSCLSFNDVNITEILKNAPRDWEIIKLFYMYEKDNFKIVDIQKNYQYILENLEDPTYSAVSYIINRKGMEKILNHSYNYSNNTINIKKEKGFPKLGLADYYLYDLTKTYLLKPCIFFPNNTKLKSTIHDEDTIFYDHSYNHLKKSIDIVKYYSKKIKKIKTINLKILNLVLYSENEEYKEMYNLTREYYKNIMNIDTIYYRFKNDIEYPIIEGDILYIPGSETFIPGVLDKTVKAFQYVYDNINISYYDYIIRTNISTIVNFVLLKEQLSSLNFDTNNTNNNNNNNKKIDYGSGLVNILRDVDKLSGIVDSTYFGLKFCSGTSIIFSPSLFKNIVENKKYLKYNIIDDVAIGILIKELFPKIYPVEIGNFEYIKDYKENLIGIKNDLNFNKTIFFRNKNDDRRTDVKQMNYIINILQNNNNYGKYLEKVGDNVYKDNNEIISKIEKENKVTFIIPTIGRKTLLNTIKSIVNQTIKDWEAIVVFDGIEPTIYTEDPRIKIIQIDKMGKGRNSAGLVRNEGMKIVKTGWIGFVDDDDYLCEDYLYFFYKHLQQDNFDTLIFRMVLDNKIIPNLKAKNFEKNDVGISFLIKKEIFDKGIHFSPSSAEDFYFLDKIRINNYKIIISPHTKYIVNYEDNKDNKTYNIGDMVKINF